MESDLKQPIPFGTNDITPQTPKLLAEQAHGLFNEIVSGLLYMLRRPCLPFHLALSVTSVARLAINHAEAANNCNQSPIELIP